MAATADAGDCEKAREIDCSFEWDDESKLYFHSSSGFYYDPSAGWYYSSRDGLYYTFENGQYVLLSGNQDEESEAHQSIGLSSSEPIDEDKPCNSDHVTAGEDENMSQPSEWLEETLINLYLSGYRNPEFTTNSSSSLQANEGQSQDPCEGLLDQLSSGRIPGCDDGFEPQQLEEGEWISEDAQERSSDKFLGKDESWEEENWLAQYGQVVRLGDEGLPSIPVVDLWDWEMVTETVKKRHQAARLIGRLVKQSNQLHPSVPAGAGRLKTASICEVHLDLVRVASGKVYRLKSPSIRYLTSLTAYDSSNPTKGWGFPDLCIDIHHIALNSCNQTSESSNADAAIMEKSSSSSGEVPCKVGKQSNVAYRDRAAERRALHGEFGIGPGQKKYLNNDYAAESSSQSSNGEEAAAEAMNIAFGQGSYARKILKKMGWKDGEALGSSTKGILEPLQASGNKGYAGLGWNHIR